MATGMLVYSVYRKHSFGDEHVILQSLCDNVKKCLSFCYNSIFEVYLLNLLGPPSVSTLSCVDLSGVVSGTVNVTLNWTLSGADSADFYHLDITTNAPQTPYGGLLNITTSSVTQYELTGFMTGYEYNITVRGVNCGSQEGSESEPLTIRPQGRRSKHYADGNFYRVV